MVATRSPQESTRRATPFGGVRPAVLAAGAYGAAALVWVVWGAHLPGGRWLAVHLFTLGVLTNLVAAMTHHFAQTLLHARKEPCTARLLAINAAALLVLTGMPTGRRELVIAGATAMTGAVLWLYADLRGMRKAALAARFAYIVRTYERACGAFMHGALLGALMGAGVLSGSWYGAARVAHLHVNVLGWGGLTLLASIVFFGPTVMRARMEPGADEAAASWLRRAATGLTVAAVALLATGAGGSIGVLARAVATAGLAVYGVGAAQVCLPVVRTGRRARPSVAAGMLQAACCWFLIGAATDVLAEATGHYRLLDAVGAVMLVGVLGQTMLASLDHVVPLAWMTASDRRATALGRADKRLWLRPLLLNLGVALIASAAVAGAPAGALGAAVARTGWLVVVVTTGFHLALLATAVASRPVSRQS